MEKCVGLGLGFLWVWVAWLAIREVRELWREKKKRESEAAARRP